MTATDGREGRIQRLPESLIDQIAAGEVVERPASVVKELVENSLDAGAQRIRIEIRDGGKALIAVSDDGFGMTRGELGLAFSRHATSKLSTLSDLERVTSFGFRGEALPAISSVSKMRVFTRARGSAEGCELQMDAGEIIAEQTAGGPEGTRIEVANLFARVPARLKFLKSAGTEWGHISDWIGRLALALPGVHFEIRRDDRPALIWPETSDTLDRIAAVLGEGMADALVPGSYEDSAGHVEAFVSAPDQTRANANGIYMFVNGRAVRDKVIRHALLQAYRDLLPRGRFPAAVLFLTLPPECVDVNVHPAKWEVRFEDPQSIHQLIRRAVRSAMEGRQWLGSHPAEGVGPALRDSARDPFAASAAGGTSQTSRTSSGQASEVRDQKGGDWILAGRPGDSRSFERAAPADLGLPGLTPASLPMGETGSDSDGALRFGNLRLLGQLLATYLLAEAKDGLLLIDQHAAHERVLYERLRAEWLEQGVSMQGLLLPLNVEVDPLSRVALEENEALVARLGFEVEPFGEGAVVIRSLPALLADRDPVGLLRSLAAELENLPAGNTGEHGEETRLLPVADKIFASLACHSARRAGDHLDPREQQQILDELDTIPWAPTCPHGRPVAVPYPLPEIERRFSRR